MPLYKLKKKGEPDSKARLVKASDKGAAIRHFVGEHEVECDAITDPALAAELAGTMKMEIAGQPVKAAEPPKVDQQQAGDDEQPPGEDEQQIDPGAPPPDKATK